MIVQRTMSGEPGSRAARAESVAVADAAGSTEESGNGGNITPQSHVGVGEAYVGLRVVVDGRAGRVVGTRGGAVCVELDGSLDVVEVDAAKLVEASRGESGAHTPSEGHQVSNTSDRSCGVSNTRRKSGGAPRSSPSTTASCNDGFSPFLSPNGSTGTSGSSMVESKRSSSLSPSLGKRSVSQSRATPSSAPSTSPHRVPRRSPTLSPVRTNWRSYNEALTAKELAPRLASVRTSLHLSPSLDSDSDNEPSEAGTARSPARSGSPLSIHAELAWGSPSPKTDEGADDRESAQSTAEAGGDSIAPAEGAACCLQEVSTALSPSSMSRSSSDAGSVDEQPPLRTTMDEVIALMTSGRRRRRRAIEAVQLQLGGLEAALSSKRAAAAARGQPQRLGEPSRAAQAEGICVGTAA